MTALYLVSFIEENLPHLVFCEWYRSHERMNLINAERPFAKPSLESIS